MKFIFSTVHEFETREEWLLALRETALYLDSPQRIAEHVAFKLNSVSWRGSDSIEYEVHSMELKHLCFAIRMIANGRMARAGRHGHRGLTLQQWKHIFENEIIYRMLHT